MGPLPPLGPDPPLLNQGCGARNSMVALCTWPLPPLFLVLFLVLLLLVGDLESFTFLTGIQDTETTALPRARRPSMDPPCDAITWGREGRSTKWPGTWL